MRLPASSSLFAFAPVLGVSLLLSGCPGGQLPEFKFSVDPQVKPVEESRPGRNGVPRPLAAVADDEGTVTSFVANEILIRPSNNDELAAFLARTGGTIVDSDALPASVNGVSIPQQYRTATQYTVRVDASAFPIENFEADVTAGLEVGGDSRFSSDEGMRLMALIASEAANGVDVAPNVAFTPAAVYMTNADGQPDDEGGVPNLLYYWPHVYDNRGSKSGMSAAWSYFAMRETPPREVRVAIIDGGFFLDAAGMPRVTGEGGATDYRLPTGATIPLQWDTLDDDGTAGGPSAARCSGGSTCNWHGEDAAMTATGILNNRVGAAGSGGQVAVPILIKSDLTTGSVKEGLRMAQALGAEIISMSFSGECDNVFCQLYYSAERYSDTFWDVYRSGVLLLAAAGNSSWDARNTIPCRYNTAVTCIGALNRDDTNAADYSSYGSNVDLFAPTGIPTYGPDNDSNVAWGDYNGTSAATPYVAGVAAMLKSADPSLTPDDIVRILRDTAGRDSADPKVTHYLRSIDALRSLFDNQFETDANEPNDTRASATTFNVNNPGVRAFGTLTLHGPDDADYFMIRVNDWVGAVFSLGHSVILSDLELTLTRVTPGTGPRASGYEYYTNGEVFRFTGLTPGDYLVRIRNKTVPHLVPRETRYDFVAEFTDEAPPTLDAYEYNNTVAAAYRFDTRRGTYHANFHGLSDVDHYRFTVGSVLGSERMDFVIRSYDAPVILTVYNEAGMQVLETNTHHAILGSGTWTVKVRAATAGIARYSFTAMGAIPPSPEQEAAFSPRPRSFWSLLAALNTIDFSVIRGAEYLLIPQGPRPKSLTVYGDVDVQLYDISGGLLREATQQPNGNGGFNTVLSTEGLEDVPELVIRVSTRAYDPAMVDEQEWADAAFPETPFSMSWH